MQSGSSRLPSPGAVITSNDLQVRGECRGEVTPDPRPGFEAFYRDVFARLTSRGLPSSRAAALAVQQAEIELAPRPTRPEASPPPARR